MSNQSDVLLALGDYRFSIDTAAPQETDQTTTYQWLDIDVVGDMPLSQFNGKGLDTFLIRGVIYPFYKGGFGQIDSMIAEADKGTPLRLVTGVGHDKGLFTIRKITQRNTQLYVKGTARKINFDIELKAYRDAS